MRVLLIDDMRTLIADRIARTFDDGVDALKNAGPWNTLLLDHDLGSYTPEGEERTGYHVILFLEENPQYRPTKVRLVTSNSVGRDRMGAALESMGYYKFSTTDYEMPNA